MLQVAITNMFLREKALPTIKDFRMNFINFWKVSTLTPSTI